MRWTHTTELVAFRYHLHFTHGKTKVRKLLQDQPLAVLTAVGLNDKPLFPTLLDYPKPFSEVNEKARNTETGISLFHYT